MIDKSRICIYFTARLYGQKVGLKADLGMWKHGKEIPYPELIKNIDSKGLACLLPKGAINPDSITVITPEEYEREYENEGGN